MPELRDWLFDAIWELSDRSIELGMPGVAEKLEEAMDIYLSECRGQGEPEFRSRRTGARPLPAMDPTEIYSRARPGTHARLRRFMESRGSRGRGR